ncbi:MAG: GAF domain-containing SpoIIE family protein phosphatase [Bacteroidota bacterium]
MTKGSISNGREETQFQLRTLLETSRLLIESRDIDVILDNLLHITMDKMRVPRGAVLLYDQKRRDYRLTRIKGHASMLEEDRLTLPWKHNEYEPIVVDPMSLGLPYPELFVGKNRGLFFNLRTSDHHLGYLYLGRKGNDGILNNQEIDFVESLSIISAVAISNSRLFGDMHKMNRKLDRRVFELNTLFELSKDFSFSISRKEIAGTFKFALLGHLMVRKFFLLFLIDGVPTVMSSSGLTRMPSQQEREEIFDLPQELLRVQPHQHETFGFLNENKIATLVALRLQGEKVAVIGVSDKATGQPLSKTSLHFLQSLGNLAVLSIQKSVFLEERIETERLEKELLIAKEVQNGLFPDHLPKVPGLNISARNVPSQHVGGDYFDVVPSPDGNHILAIGDVSGKGFPAALLMANLQSMLHVLLPVPISLSEATGRINNLIFHNTPSDRFVTFFWAKYFHNERRLRYINAGHNPPLLLKKQSNEVAELREGGMILGVVPTVTPYEETDVQLEEGDLLVCFTDGITEAFNEKDEEYGKQRLIDLLYRVRDKSPQNIMDAIIQDVNRFSNHVQADDFTLIVVKGTPEGRHP